MKACYYTAKGIINMNIPDFSITAHIKSRLLKVTRQEAGTAREIKSICFIKIIKGTKAKPQF